MSDCPARTLILARHLSAHGHAAVAACTEGDDHERDGWHRGPMLEVDGDQVIRTFTTLVVWDGRDRRHFDRPDGPAHGLEPPTCPKPITDRPGARCCLPARHDGRCAP